MLYLKNVGVFGKGSLNTVHTLVATQIFKRLAELGVHLRTTGAEGIEMIAIKEYKKKIDEGFIDPSRVNIFLPWHGFNTVMSGYPGQVYTSLSIANYSRCESIIRSVHKGWNGLLPKTKKLHANNALAMLGKDLDKPVDFLIVFAKPHHSLGYEGTVSSVVELATEMKIPVFNLYDFENIDKTLYELRSYLRESGFPVIAEKYVPSTVKLKDLVGCGGPLHA